MNATANQKIEILRELELLISIVSLMEILYLAEKNRIPIDLSSDARFAELAEFRIIWD